MSGRFITIEGGEGSGKSTQISLLKNALEEQNISHILTREPGGEAGAEAIRELLVTGDKSRWDALAETLLFSAARVQHIARLIRPALAEGKWVICDRFVDSTRVYQGVGKGVSKSMVDELHRLTLGNFMPDCTIILDIDPQVGVGRAKGRQGHETRFEEMDMAFHQQVRDGFLAIAKEEPGRCHVIDASQPVEVIHAQIMAVLLA